MNKHFDQLRRTWDHLGESDPLWAILTDPQKRGNRWDLESFFETGRHEVDTVLKIVADCFPNVPRLCALDFGCGVGRLTRALAAHFDRAIGVDIAASMISHAQQLNRDVRGCEFVLNERADLSFIASNSVDFVYSNIVLQHIERPYSNLYIQEFVRVLSPRGLAVFQVPYQLQGAAAEFLYHWIPNPLLRLYRFIRYGQQRIEMHTIPIEQVHDIVCKAGGRVIRCDESGAAGNLFKSKLYFVLRLDVAQLEDIPSSEPPMRKGLKANR
jgi:SAM-dependent methyltransferase